MGDTRTLICTECSTPFDVTLWVAGNADPVCPACRGENAPLRRRARRVSPDVARQVRLARIGDSIRQREQQIMADHRQRVAA